MDHIGKTESPLYKYNPRTHTYSFGKNEPRKNRWLIIIAIILISIIVICLLAGMIKSIDDKDTLNLSNIPVYSGEPYFEINNNIPFFDENDINTQVFETYGELDSIGRCTYGYANVCLDLMPVEERESIQSVIPTGWQTVTYDFIDQGYLYNRCHLIAYMLTGENDNERNIITGTRYMNVEGMLPFENKVAKYIELTGNHVLYRVTPIFEENNLVASGVEMEALSVEDGGENICFNVFVYNVQPGVEINYKTGESRINE